MGVLPGHQASDRREGLAVAARWSPWTFASGTEGDPIARGQLAAGLREIVDGCVGAWSSRFSNVLIGVSGGVDSSIIAAAATVHADGVKLFTRYTDDAAGDERPYAKALANHLGLGLAELQFEPDRVDVRQTNSVGMARPCGHTLAQESIRLLKAMTSEPGRYGYFSGVGGDGVFCYLKSASVVADRVMREGLGQGALKSLLDICRVADCSIWEAGIRAFRKAVSGVRIYHEPLDGRLLTDSAKLLPNSQIPHPWLVPPDGAVPGKIQHILAILRNHIGLDAWPVEGIEVVSPLLSQPVVEYCLRIPTWEWCASGINRAVAREAYADLLPVSVVHRRSKGTPGGAVATVFERNKSVLREMLCGGALVEHGIVEADAVASVLDNRKGLIGTDYARVLQLADAEAWARGWQ